MNKLCVFHVMENYLPFTQTFVYGFLTGFDRIKACVYARKKSNTELFPFERVYSPKDIKKYSLEWLSERVLRKVQENDPYLEKLIKKNDIQIVHAHFGPEAVRILSLKRKLNFTLVTTFYGYDMSQLAERIEWQNAYKKLFAMGEIFCVEGHHMKKGLMKLGCPEHKIRVIRIAINCSKITYKERQQGSDKCTRILFCGRFVEKKGLLFGLKALKILKDKNYRFKFVIVGDGPLKKEIYSYVDEHGLKDYCEFKGYLTNEQLRQEMAECAILMQPSCEAKDGDSEGGAPTILLEAQAAGVPIVSTKHADIPEVVIDEKSGFLADEHDEDDLAEKLIRMIEQESSWKDMGQAGRKFMLKQHDRSVVIPNLENVYEEALST